MKVYNYVSHWHNGVAFEGSVYAKVFATLEEAKQMLYNEAEQATTSMNNHYDDCYIKYDSENVFEKLENGALRYCIVGDSDEYQNDWWEGFIFEQEI